MNAKQLWKQAYRAARFTWDPCMALDWLDPGHTLPERAALLVLALRDREDPLVWRHACRKALGA